MPTLQARTRGLLYRRTMRAISEVYADYNFRADLITTFYCNSIFLL